MNLQPSSNQGFRLCELWRLSNLLSLIRILVIPVLWYYLAKPDTISSYMALLILILAGFTDWLDGYFARKLKQTSMTGMVLDPLADKILAAFLAVMLIFYRDFPLWLAATIISRDLVILMASATLLRGKNVVVPSTITGKYAFFFIVILLACSVIRFEYGVWLTTYICFVLIALSIIIYTRLFDRIRRGKSFLPFKDISLFKFVRVSLTALVLAFLLIKLYLSLG